MFLFTHPPPHQTTTTTTKSIDPQSLYGIIQGGVYEDLRRRSTAFVNDHAFFGAAIGGSLGSDKRMMYVNVLVYCVDSFVYWLLVQA